MDKPPVPQDLITPPILWQPNDPDENAAAQAYFDALRDHHLPIARAEAQRLRESGYFKQMTRQLQDDLARDGLVQALPGQDAASVLTNWSFAGLKDAVRVVGNRVARGNRPRHPKAAQMTRRQLRLLFEAVAARTANIILSQVMLGPISMLDKRLNWSPARIFAQPKKYNSAEYTLGFVQIEQKGGANKASVSVPFFGFADRLLGYIASHRPEVMLKAFQQVLTAGNHDMQHHLTNTTLNPTIANIASAEVLAPRCDIKDWSKRHFDVWSDADVGSYESWLILNHARIQSRLMTDDKTVAGAVDTFLAELARIGREIREAQGDIPASHTVDYFGTMLGFVMMRFLPFNHPVFAETLQRLEAMDPLAQQIERSKASIEAFMKVKLYYLDAGQRLETTNYAVRKIGDIARLAPEIARLNVPDLNTGGMDEVHGRVGRVYHEMLQAAAHTAWFLPDGNHEITLEDGEMLELHCRDGQPCRDDGGPAVVVTSNILELKSKSVWYVDGLPGRDKGLPWMLLSYEGQSALWGYIHMEKYRSEHLPLDAQQANAVEVNDQGHRSHIWYHKGEFSRRITVDANNNLIEDSHPSRPPYKLTQPLAYPPASQPLSSPQVSAEKRVAIPTPAAT